MLKFALFGVILLALQTSGQYQSQSGYQPNYNRQPDPCVPCNPLPPCPPHWQPPNPAYYPAPYQAPNPTPYSAPNMFAHPYPGSILPIAIPVYYNSKDWNNPLRNNGIGNGDDRDLDLPSDTPNQPPYQPTRPPKRHLTPPYNSPDAPPNPSQPPNNPPNHTPNDSSNHYPNPSTNDPLTPTDNNYEPQDSPSRSGRPRLLSAMVSRLPEVSVPGRNGLFSNIGVAAGNWADALFK